jgi:hypothetical protein
MKQFERLDHLQTIGARKSMRLTINKAAGIKILALGVLLALMAAFMLLEASRSSPSSPGADWGR